MFKRFITYLKTTKDMQPSHIAKVTGIALAGYAGVHATNSAVKTHDYYLQYKSNENILEFQQKSNENFLEFQQKSLEFQQKSNENTLEFQQKYNINLKEQVEFQQKYNINLKEQVDLQSKLKS